MSGANPDRFIRVSVPPRLALVGCGVVDCVARRNPMRPTDKTRNQDLARRQGDHSTLYVSLELSRSSWLVTSLSPNSEKMSKHSIAAGDAPKLLALPVLQASYALRRNGPRRCAELVAPNLGESPRL